MPTKLEEVMEDTDGGTTQNLLPHRNEERLGGVAWRNPHGRSRQHGILRQQQRTPVELAAGGDGQSVERDNVGRHHVAGQPICQIRVELRQKEILDLGLERLVGVIRPVPGRVAIELGGNEVSLFISAWLGPVPSQQSSVPTVRAMVPPVDESPVAGTLGELPDLLRLHTPRRLLLCTPGFDRLRSGFPLQPTKGPHRLLHSRVGNITQSNPVRPVAVQHLAQLGKGQPFGGPVDFWAIQACVFPGPRSGSDIQHHLIAEHRHLIEPAVTLGTDLNPAVNTGTGCPIPEERGVKGQLFFLPHSVLNTLPELLTRHRVRHALCLDTGVESLEQRETTDITNDDPPAIGDSGQRPFQDAHEVINVGEVLDHRVDDDGVHRIQAQIADAVGLPLAQGDDLLQLWMGVKTATDGLQSR